MWLRFFRFDGVGDSLARDKRCIHVSNLIARAYSRELSQKEDIEQIC